MTGYCIGVDIGQVHDPTAIAVCQVDDDRLAVRHLERLAGVPYPDQVERIAAVVEDVERLAHASLTVDATGVGRPVVDLLRVRLPQVALRAVVVHGGEATSHDDAGFWRVPKRDLIAGAQVALQARRVVISSKLPDAALLVRELTAYRVKIDTRGHDSYGNDWRQEAHDDLVFALCLAVWDAKRAEWIEPGSSAGYALRR